MAIGRFELTTRISAPADVVWASATSEEGINHELRPLIRMTMPPGLRGRSIAEIDPPERPGRSWLLLFGLIPFDYDDLGIEEIGPGNRFLERSSMASMSLWQHERIVEPDREDACLVTDRLTMELRRPLRWIPRSERLAEAIVGALFRRRHRRLSALYPG